MGLYERDYGRNERTPWDRIENPRSFVTILIVINVAVFLLGAILRGDKDSEGVLLNWFGLHPSSLIQPWRWYETLTYGFLHDSRSILHILFNMFLLFVFGRIIQQRNGNQEFLKFYLAAVIVGGIVAMITPWVMILIGTGWIDSRMIGGVTIGASGAVMALTVLFACYYPNQELLFMFLFPMKAWVLAMLIVVMDLASAAGLMGNAGSETAFEVHLAGAAFGFLYYNRGWNFGWLDLERIGEIPSLIRRKSRRARLKVHDPDRKIRQEAEEADRILAKIHEQGESSLTGAERRTLQRYSRRQREKRESME